MWIDWNYPQSAVALHIYRVGRSVPIKSRNPIKSRVKIQLLTRTGRFGPVWPVSGPIWPVRPGCRSSGRHNSLIRTPNWTFYICISIVSMRSMQWLSSLCFLSNLTRPVWPVSGTGLTGPPSRDIFLCKQYVASTFLYGAWQGVCTPPQYHFWRFFCIFNPNLGKGNPRQNFG